MEQRVLGGLEAAHVDQRQHHAVDRALGAIGQDAQEERRARALAQLALDRLAGREHALAGRRPARDGRCLCVNVSIERPTSCGSRLNALGDLRRELADLELASRKIVPMSVLDSRLSMSLVSSVSSAILRWYSALTV